MSQRSDASCEYWEISSLTQILDDNDDGDVSVCASVCTCVWFGSWWPASALHSPLVQSVTVWAWQCLFQTQTYKYDCWSSYPTHPSHVHLLCFKREGGVRVCSEGRGEAASTNTSVATGRMAVEGYFLPLCSAVFLVTPLQFVNLAALLKHKTDSTSLLFPHQIHTEHTVLLHYASLCFFSGNKDWMQGSQVETFYLLTY